MKGSKVGTARFSQIHWPAQVPPDVRVGHFLAAEQERKGDHENAQRGVGRLPREANGIALRRIRTARHGNGNRGIENIVSDGESPS